jgi:glycosyltransferase involved in cell wall biosynthesis
VVEECATSLRMVVLAHMVSASFPAADPRVRGDEKRALRAARSVIVTSEWTRSELVRRQLVPPERIVVATPGADGATASAGSSGGGELLCVGVVAAHKGQDILVEALATLRANAAWRCTFVGSSAADPAFAKRVAARAADLGVAERITMTGVLSGAELDAAYRRADLLVAPSRVESYGMAIADALGRGIPVLASRVGGIPRTVAPGRAALLVPPDAGSLSIALDRWLVEPALRRRLKGAALRGSAGRPRWTDTVDRVAVALAGVR